MFTDIFVNVDGFQKFFFGWLEFTSEVVPFSPVPDLMMGSRRNRGQPSNFIGTWTAFYIFSEVILALLLASIML